MTVKKYLMLAMFMDCGHSHDMHHNGVNANPMEEDMTASRLERTALCQGSVGSQHRLHDGGTQPSGSVFFQPELTYMPVTA